MDAGEGTIINLLWGRDKIQDLGEFPVGVNSKRALHRYGEVYSKNRAAALYINAVHEHIKSVHEYGSRCPQR